MEIPFWVTLSVVGYEEKKFVMFAKDQFTVERFIVDWVDEHCDGNQIEKLVVERG